MDLNDDSREKAQPVTMADMFAWYKMQEEMKKLKEAEMALRKRIFSSKFMAPMEGVNTVELDDGYQLKGTRKIDRKVDIGACRVLSEKDGVFEKAGIVGDTLVDWKPELALSAYRALPPEKRLVFDRCLIIKDGSPSLEIVLPSAARKRK